VVTIAEGPSGDGKTDTYPTRGRPTFAFQEASLINHMLMNGKHFTCPHTYWGIETAITAMSNILEDSEHLATTRLPLPYAQVTRLLTLGFLLVVPFAYTTSLGWAIIPLSLVANLVYFLIDECSGQMETPFETKPNDVELEKTLRRIDKLTAAQVSQFLGRPVSNFNLFPEKATTDKDHVVTTKVKSMGNQNVVVEPDRSSHSPFHHHSHKDRSSDKDDSKRSERSRSPSPVKLSPAEVAIESAAP